MFAEAGLTAEAKIEAPQPHLKQLRPYPALQRVPSSLHKALLLSMNNEPIWVKNNFLFPLSYFFFFKPDHPHKSSPQSCSANHSSSRKAAAKMQGQSKQSWA